MIYPVCKNSSSGGEIAGSLQLKMWVDVLFTSQNLQNYVNTKIKKIKK